MGPKKASERVKAKRKNNENSNKDLSVAKGVTVCFFVLDV